MALILSEREVDDPRHGKTRRHWIYNCIDSSITNEVADVLLPMLENDPLAKRIYQFSMALQVPTMAMTLRGIRTDPAAIAEAQALLEAEEKVATAKVAEIAGPYWKEREPRKGKCEDGKLHRWSNSVVEWRKQCKEHGTSSALVQQLTCPTDDKAVCVKCGVPKLIAKGVNPHSPPQMIRLLYDELDLPRQHNHKTRKVSVDDECIANLKRLGQQGKGKEGKKCAPFVPLLDAIIAARKARKQRGLVNARLDDDGRWRSSVNVGAAVTGRFSTSKSPRWTGGNIQNIADKSRHIFVADPGLVMVYADYEQAESRVCAHDAKDQAYIDAHETGDVHTSVCKMVWADMPWPEKLNCGRKEHLEDGTCCARGLAELSAPWDPDHELRWYGKHIAHGSAIGMSEYGIARDAHVPVDLARKAQQAFFRRFQRLRDHQGEIINQVKQTGQLVTFLGRKRQFYGRLWDPATMREALAQTQQSAIVDWVSIAMWMIHHELDTCLDLGEAPNPDQPNKVWLLAQIHDALLFEVRIGDDETLKRVVELMSFGQTIHGRRLVIPCDVKVGLTWRKDDMHRWRPGFNWSVFK